MPVNGPVLPAITAQCTGYMLRGNQAAAMPPLHQTVPENRTLLKMLRERHGVETATRRYVQNLFPYGFGQQACKIAGMRKPLKLLLDL